MFNLEIFFFISYRFLQALLPHKPLTFPNIFWTFQKNYTGWVLYLIFQGILEISSAKKKTFFSSFFFGLSQFWWCGPKISIWAEFVHAIFSVSLQLIQMLLLVHHAFSIMGKVRLACDNSSLITLLLHQHCRQPTTPASAKFYCSSFAVIWAFYFLLRRSCLDSHSSPQLVFLKTLQIV